MSRDCLASSQVDGPYPSLGLESLERLPTLGLTTGAISVSFLLSLGLCPAWYSAPRMWDSILGHDGAAAE